MLKGIDCSFFFVVIGSKFKGRLTYPQEQGPVGDWSSLDTYWLFGLVFNQNNFRMSKTHSLSFKLYFSCVQA